MATLDDERISERLAQLDGWEREGDAITKTFDRGDFVGAVRFVDAMVPAAEEMNHHPDISISWSEVEVRLSTHSEGGLTENDFRLAATIDELA